MRLRAILIWSFPAGIVLTLLARLTPGAVETFYARGVYRAIAAVFAVLTGWIPFSVAEPLLVALLALLVWRVVRWARALAKPSEPRRAIVKRAAATCAIVAGVGYVAFLLLWGLNYHRRPLAANLGLETRDASAAELAALCDELVAEANASRPDDSAFASADMRAAYDALAEREPLVRGVYGRPKSPLLSPLLARLGVTGIYSPLTGEPHVNSTLPAAAIPATTAHEMAHHRGFAGEDEATFIGVRACRASDSAAVRYSGVFEALLWSLDALAAADAEAYKRVRRRVSRAVQRDFDAWAAWRVRYASPARAVGERVNDVYLLANAQAGGVRSYGRVVDLLLAERRLRATSP